MIFHVFNRGNARETIFFDDADYEAFEKVLADTMEQVSMRVLGYCLMPNHWHLVLWPVHDGDLARFVQRLTTTHVRRWHRDRQSVGGGYVYQGNYKSFPIQRDDHLLTVLRYVVCNPVRSGLVTRAAQWRFSSFWRWLHPGENKDGPRLGAWPVARPADWKARVNRAIGKKELEAIRLSVVRGRPFGDEDWQKRTTKRLGLESTFRSRGRPRKAAGDVPK